MLQGEVKGFSLAENHQLFRFKSVEERDATLYGGLWVVAGQLLPSDPRFRTLSQGRTSSGER